MKDLPCIVLAATVWAYWACVGAMIVRVRRHTRKLSGIVPIQRVEQLMWIVWVPLVAAWMTLPYLAATPVGPPRGLPDFARETPVTALRWAAAGVGIVCLVLSIDCWLRMGKNWRMAVTPDQSTELVTTGLYRRVRHPIYALSILLMLCTLVVVPTVPVGVMAVVHIALMVVKARNEERFLSERHGASYLRYLERTGRFMPRLRAKGAGPERIAMTVRRSCLRALLACLFLGSVGASGPAFTQEEARPGVVAEDDEFDPQLEQRLLALDPQSISERDVGEVLARVPAPRIIALHGSLPIHTMAPFAEFLVAMGYPAERLRNPRDGRLTYSSFVDSRELAGAIAWHYERDGVMPLLIGHSQGGMVAIKVLQDLAGASGQQLPVWDPVRGRAENRHSIVDPRSGLERPVVGLQVPYAAALATGSVMRVLLGQWEMLARLRSVPDSVDEFTGYFTAWDAIAGTGRDAARDDPYRATGRAWVRNVVLPADYGHLTLPLARHLAADPDTRRWIGAFDPRTQPAVPPAIPGADLRNIVHAADIWFSVKKHWCLEAQRYVSARRALHRLRS